MVTVCWAGKEEVGERREGKSKIDFIIVVKTFKL